MFYAVLAFNRVSILSPHQHGLQRPCLSAVVPLMMFQSSARINTGCNTSLSRRAIERIVFQSSARINTGCNTAGHVRIVNVIPVSILSPHQHGLQRRT